MASPEHTCAPPPPYPTLVSASMLPPLAVAPSASFGAIIQQLRIQNNFFYQPRLNCHYDVAAAALKASIELPGVCKDNLHVTLVDSAINHVRNLSIWGFLLPPYSPISGVTSAAASGAEAPQSASGPYPGSNMPFQYMLRERKYGEFYRLLPVPPETKSNDVLVILDAGVLYVTVSFQKPLTQEEVDASREVINLT
ncbi:hypothetical protein BDP27DRAFT_1367065 [Rhodocollybia butyracea]|uniref:Uncharacterized protein n=1 Tax=Rhodocollybia butyracea TaxID=206335 RepID=A0A9P5U4B7_9AGAR|nr:hypothetical protein BDP27DRAFT_1367065 [Rhodocollybia butyracea]